MTAGLRAGSWAWRRARQHALPVLYPGMRLGSGCDVRRGLQVTVGPCGLVDIGERCILDRRMTIEAYGSLQVGSGTIFGHTCTVAAKDSIRIGSDVLIAEMVSIRDHDHRFEARDVPIREQGAVTAPVVLEDGVWLGTRVIVTKGVHIGTGAVVGAGAVVTRDLPAWSIAVGVPARVVGHRA